MQFVIYGSFIFVRGTGKFNYCDCPSVMKVYREIPDANMLLRLSAVFSKKITGLLLPIPVDSFFSGSSYSIATYLDFCDLILDLFSNEDAAIGSLLIILNKADMVNRNDTPKWITQENIKNLFDERVKELHEDISKHYKFLRFMMRNLSRINPVLADVVDKGESREFIEQRLSQMTAFIPTQALVINTRDDDRIKFEESFHDLLGKINRLWAEEKQVRSDDSLDGRKHFLFAQKVILDSKELFDVILSICSVMSSGVLWKQSGMI